MKRSASLPLVIQSFRPFRTNPSPVRGGARRERERVAAGSGLRERVGADAFSRQASEGSAASDLVGAPAQDRVDHERVLNVDEDADRRIDPRELLDRYDRVEEAGAGAAVASREFRCPSRRGRTARRPATSGSSPARPSRARAAALGLRRTLERCREVSVRLRKAGSGVERFLLAAGTRAECYHRESKGRMGVRKLSRPSWRSSRRG